MTAGEGEIIISNDEHFMDSCFPFSYFTHGGARIFSLPGNPVSVMATFYLFAQDALRRLEDGVAAYGVEPDEDVPATLDYIVGAVGG